MSLAMKIKKTQGRKKIEMKMIENENARRITFSKRRTGLFKKASELSTLCGVEIAIIVFSLGGRAFSFGHPNVDSIVERFLNKNRLSGEHTSRSVVPFRDTRLRELKQQFNKLSEQLEGKKKKGKMPQESGEDSEGQSFDEYVNRLGLHELQRLKGVMGKLKDTIVNEMHSKATLGQPNTMDPSTIMGNEAGHISDPIPQNWLSL